MTAVGSDEATTRKLLRIAGHAISQGQEATGVSRLARTDFCENNAKRLEHSFFRYKVGRFEGSLRLVWNLWHITCSGRHYCDPAHPMLPPGT
jgi:hypothetical protein